MAEYNLEPDFFKKPERKTQSTRQPPIKQTKALTVDDEDITASGRFAFIKNHKLIIIIALIVVIILVMTITLFVFKRKPSKDKLVDAKSPNQPTRQSKNNKQQDDRQSVDNRQTDNGSTYNDRQQVDNRQTDNRSTYNDRQQVDNRQTDNRQTDNRSTYNDRQQVDNRQTDNRQQIDDRSTYNDRQQVDNRQSNNRQSVDNRIQTPLDHNELVATVDDEEISKYVSANKPLDKNISADNDDNELEDDEDV